MVLFGSGSLVSQLHAGAGPMKLDRDPQVGDWVMRPGLDDDGPILVVDVDGSGLFKGRHWRTDMGRWGSPTHLGVYPVDSSYGWMLVEPPVGLPGECRAIFGHGYEPFFCELPLGHDGKHRQSGDNYICEWSDR